jgi:hypothetical protein
MAMFHRDEHQASRMMIPLRSHPRLRSRIILSKDAINPFSTRVPINTGSLGLSGLVLEISSDPTNSSSEFSLFRHSCRSVAPASSH